MNTLWTFGDSFTHFDYQGVDTQYSSDIILWSDIVGQTLNLQVQNLGCVAYSNQQIIAEINKNLWKIQKGDFVVIGLSTPFRTLTVRNGMIRAFLSQDYLQTKTQEEKWVFDYVQNIIYPNEQLFEEFYWTQVNGIKKLLDSQNCTTYLWDYKLWDTFETIKSQSKGKDKDPHWSRKGHEDMARYVLEKLNKTTKGVI